MSFPPSKIVWQRYPGQGIQIQWLGDVRRGQRLLPLGTRKREPAPAVEEVIPLATERAGGIAWEYCSTSTAARRRGRAGSRRAPRCRCSPAPGSDSKNLPFTEAAKQALGIFQQPPPNGVRIATKPAPGTRSTPSRLRPHPERLHPGRRRALRLHLDHERPARPAAVRSGRRRGPRAVAHYDTGAWSLYDQFGESDLSYHELLHRIPPAPVRTHPQRPASLDDAAGRRNCAGYDPRRPRRRPSAPAAGPPPRRPRGRDEHRNADRRRSDLLHDRQEIRRIREDAASGLAAQPHAEGRHAGRRAGLALEDLDGHDQGAEGLEARLHEQRDGGRRQAEAALADPFRAAAPTRSTSRRATSRATSRRPAGRSS